MTVTKTDLEKARFYDAPQIFGDGANGLAFQTHDSPDYPRLQRTHRREKKGVEWRSFFEVDGTEVKDLDEAAQKLNVPIDPDCYYAKRLKRIEEVKAQKAARAALPPIE